jgi:hypothetical protein
LVHFRPLVVLSQNAAFAGSVDPDPEFDHPPGFSIVRALADGLGTLGWSLDEPDNWRDCGWSMAARRAGCEIEIVLAAIETERHADRFALQIAPLRSTGVLARWLGRKPSATPAECHALATEVHAVLHPRFAPLRWCWDGFPDERSSTEPPPP